MGMVITVLVLIAVAFVLLLTWGDSDSAPRFVRQMNMAITQWQMHTLLRFGAWRQRRRENAFPANMAGRHYLSNGIRANSNAKRQGSPVQILSPVTDPAERRMFFLWEVGFHTELDLTVEEPNRVRVSKRDMRVLEEYCNVYATKPGKATDVFRANGLLLEQQH